MRILIDVDNVVADFVTVALEAVFVVTGRRHSHDDVTDHTIAKALDLNEDEEKRFLDHLCAPGFVSQMPLIAGAKESIERLDSDGHDIFFVTTHYRKSRTWVGDRDEWLLAHFGDLGERTVYTKYKHVASGDILIDDRPELLVPWREQQSGLTVLFDCPHNRSFDGYVDCRAHGWEEVLDFIGDQALRRKEWDTWP